MTMENTRLLVEILGLIYAAGTTYFLFVLHHMVSQAEALVKEAQDRADRKTAEATIAREKEAEARKAESAAWQTCEAYRERSEQECNKVQKLQEKVAALTDAIAKLSGPRWEFPKDEKPKRKRA